MKPNTKYYLDKETLTYKPVKRNSAQVVKSNIKYLTSLSLIGALAFLLLATNNITPHQVLLSQKNKKLSGEIINKSEQIKELESTLANIEENDDIIYRSFAELKPLSDDIRNGGFGGTDRYREFAGLEYSAEISNVIRGFDKLEQKIKIQKKSFDDIEPLVSYFDEFYASKPAIRPISQKDELFISSYYGRRFHPIHKRWMTHHGIDYAARIGSPVYVTGKGIVKAAYYARGYGRVVKVDHGFGYLSVYAHLNKYIVKKGDTLQRGQLVGYVGNTGISTGPHLHYEIRKNNRTKNPLYFYIDDLKEEEYQKVVSR